MNHVIWLAALAIALVVVAALLRITRDVARSRVRLRRTALLFIPYALLALLAIFRHRLGDGLWLSVVQIAADFLAILLAINLAAAAVFDFSLKLVRLRAPDIL